MQITGTRNLETQAFLADASQLTAVQQEQQHTEQGIAQLAGQRKATKDHIASLLAKQNSILSSLTGTELTAVQQGTVERRRRHDERRLHRADRLPGGHGGRLRLQAARLPLQLWLHRPVQRRLRLLRPGDEGLGGGGHHDPARHLQQWAALPHIAASAHPAG